MVLIIASKNEDLMKIFYKDSMTFSMAEQAFLE
jgi:hypothetical protein